MKSALCISGLFAICIVSNQDVARAQLPVSSLCDLQAKAAHGEHRTVRVEGVFLAGLEGQGLVNVGCGGRSTYVEFELKTRLNRRRLWRLVDKTNRRMHWRGAGDAVLVVFEGEFYGPPTPDPKLPERVRKAYHPSWGNSGEMTRLVVYSIQSVKTLPADHPCAPPKSDPNQWPCYQHDPSAH